MQDPNFVIPLIDQKYLNAIKTKYFDLPYANQSKSQILDIYFPNIESKEPYPVVVYFHGGAFMIGTKLDDALEPMLRATEKGYVVISAEYRRSKEARFPAMLYDAKAVIRWVRANAKKFNLDADKIAVWGPSSGGWIVSMLAVTNNNPAFEDLSMGNKEYSSSVNAVVNWCGPTSNFLKMDEAFKVSKCGIPDHDDPMSPESLFLGSQITHIPELCKFSAPVTHVNKDIPPFCIFHGELDQVVPVEQSIILASKIKEICGEEKVELHIEKGKIHHGHPWYHERWVSDACINFLDKKFNRK